MSHWTHLNIFPDEIIALNRELVNHPKLQERLATNHFNTQEDWLMKLTEIALYCEVIVDGTYEPDQIVKLAGILTKKLIERREDNRGLLIVMPH